MHLLFHLLRYQLRHHRIIYLLAAVLIFVSQFPPPVSWIDAGGSFWVRLGQLGITAVVARLLMREHPWHSDTAFWRSRPITPRMLFASQMLALGLVVLLPFAVGLLLRVLPLSLGPLPATLAVLVPLATAAVLVITLATCASLATGNRGRDLLPYFAAFVVPLLSMAVFGVVHTLMVGHRGSPSPGDGQILSQFLCGLALLAVTAPVALLLATLGRRLRPAIATLLAAGLILPWVVAGVSVDFFPSFTPPSRTIGIEIPPLEPDSNRRPPPRWTGLDEGEFFAPRHLLASWTVGGRNHPWQWPNNQSPGPGYAPRLNLNSDLLRISSYLSSLEDHLKQFAAAADMPAIWESIRARLPAHRTWRSVEAARHIHDPLDLGAGPDIPGFSLHAVGDIYQFEALGPLSPVTRGRIDSPRPGRIEIQRIAHDDSQIAILLRQTMANPSLFDPFQRSGYYSTSPPEFWAVLLHPATSTAYACYGIRFRTGYGLPGTSITETRHHLLSFKLPRLETRLLGLDPQHLLAESELHLFHAVPVAHGKVDLSATANRDSDPAGRITNPTGEKDESGL